MGPRKTITCFVVAAAMLSGATSSLADEQTRDGYKADVEPICKLNTEANARILRGVREEIRAGKLRQAGRRFARAASALKRTRGQLLAVPKPPADSPKLTRWLKYIASEARLLERVARKLEKGEKAAASRLAVRLISTITGANNEVLEFEFEYCHVKPSQFV